MEPFGYGEKTFIKVKLWVYLLPLSDLRLHIKDARRSGIYDMHTTRPLSPPFSQVPLLDLPLRHVAATLGPGSRSVERDGGAV